MEKRPRPPEPEWMRPAWVRWLLCLVPAAWAVGELTFGQTSWALMFAAAAAWGFWTLIVKRQPD